MAATADERNGERWGWGRDKPGVEISINFQDCALRILVNPVFREAVKPASELRPSSLRLCYAMGQEIISKDFFFNDFFF